MMHRKATRFVFNDYSRHSSVTDMLTRNQLNLNFINNNNELYNVEAALKVQWIEINMAMNTRIHTN